MDKYSTFPYPIAIWANRNLCCSEKATLMQYCAHFFEYNELFEYQLLSYEDLLEHVHQKCKNSLIKKMKTLVNKGYMERLFNYNFYRERYPNYYRLTTKVMDECVKHGWTL